MLLFLVWHPFAGNAATPILIWVHNVPVVPVTFDWLDSLFRIFLGWFKWSPLATSGAMLFHEVEEEELEEETSFMQFLDRDKEMFLFKVAKRWFPIYRYLVDASIYSNMRKGFWWLLKNGSWRMLKGPRDWWAWCWDLHFLGVKKMCMWSKNPPSFPPRGDSHL